MPIPKIIHQIWIGSNPPPLNLMNTWKNKHPNYEYIFWTEEEISKRKLVMQCYEKFNLINEIVGKVDILRLEILYQYGGIYIDADSICIEPFDDFFLEQGAFASYENENIREKLVATGTMGFEKNHKLCKDMLDWIKSSESNKFINHYKAWYSVGPACLTRFLDTGNYPDFMVFPSYFFLPHHFTGIKYEGHKKIYAHQEWCNTDNKYKTINSAVIPIDLQEPTVWVSVLISSYNTDPIYIKDCLESIKNQVGHFGIELVWINDGSSDSMSNFLKEELRRFKHSTRFCKIIYKRNEKNMGLSFSLNRGVLSCSNELIFRMDADDIMFPNRIQKQLEFMNNNVDCMMCGANIRMITEHKKKMETTTNHPTIVMLEDFIEKPRNWFMNHPTLCFRKSSVLTVGNYNDKMGPEWILEDFELGLKILKRFGKIYNLPDILLLYRVHRDQLTRKFDTDSIDNENKRQQMIKELLN